MRKFIFGILVVCTLLTGCSIEINTRVTGGWTVTLTDQQASINDEALDVFNRAMDKSKENYKLVALLGTQVVAGINYMFLCEDEGYKIVVVYNDLQNESTIISVSDFDFTKYVNRNISYDDEYVVGGWHVNVPSKAAPIDMEIKDIFDTAISDVEDITYLPIAVMGEQLVSGINYAILCYGKSNDERNGVYLLTIYENLNADPTLSSAAYIDLADLY